ncbi:hypothetical protein R3W88_011988 [Solanum pinnatisectum]|uniref:Ubiquitin-like protease family profile domain-containing protein n=1 Tax=Solanum pinnatisectum TaxID=50273 RepID=A0AAV9LA94_9SOLN|nr:hypothetical protein R3W88_011988 [Solanum pinnatisectum]
MSSFSQWINEGLYKHHAKNVISEYENKIIGTIKEFGIPAGLPWHLTNEVYVPVNCNGEFHWVLAVYDSMSSSRTNRKLCTEIQKLSTILPKYLESSGFYEQKDRTNWPVLESHQGKKNLTHSKSYMLLVLPNKQAIVCNDCGVFVATYAEFLSDGLQIPYDGIISQSLRLRYASLL